MDATTDTTHPSRDHVKVRLTADAAPYTDRWCAHGPWSACVALHCDPDDLDAGAVHPEGA